MPETFTNFPALRAVIDKGHDDAALSLIEESKRIRDADIEIETNIVARLMADRKQAEIYLTPELQHMQVWSWWEDQLMYQAFMLCLALAERDAPMDWSRKMVERGKKLLEKEKMK